MADFEQYNLPSTPTDQELNIVPTPGGSMLSNGSFQSPNYTAQNRGWMIDAEGNAEFNDGTFRGTFSLGGTVITIDNTQNIQTYLDTINAAGGGTLYLKPGTYTLTAAGITMYGGVSLVGTSPSGTIIDFNSTAGEINITGTHRYSTGTITSITSGVNVTGSGTSWLANVVAGRDHFFINGQWMLIAAVTGDTTLVLAEGYDGATISAGTAYRISTPIQNVTLKGFNVKNSTGAGIDVDDARFFVVENVYQQDNNIGIDGAYVTEFSIDLIVPVSNTSHGVSVTNGGRLRWGSVNSVSNGGSGIALNSVRSMGFSEGVANSNTADGFNITSCTDISLITFDASANGSNGVECVSGNTSLAFIDASMRGNTSDGLKLTATSDTCIVMGGSFEGNGGYGINIAASTCDNNMIVSPQYASNSSGTLSDSGTGTVVVASIAGTETFTNKRITPRITTIASHATPTINTDNCDAVTITAQAEAITSMTTNLSGTPTNFQKLIVRIKDDGTARAITWGASFEAKGVALPTTTVISKVLTVGFIYDTVSAKWGCVATAQEA